MNKPAEFDAILHLAGEQPLPIYIGLMQFDCPRHVIAVTSLTKHVGETVKAQAPVGRQIELVTLPPYRPAEAARIMRGEIERIPGSKWALNLTGGTKPMFAAALRTAQTTGSRAFYVETANKTLDWLHDDWKIEPLKPVMNKLDSFIALAGYKVNRQFAEQSAVIAGSRKDVSEFCWKQRRTLALSYRRLSDHAKHPGVQFHERNREGFDAELHGPPDYSGTLRFGGHVFSAKPWKDMACFLAGGWFEEFVWTKLHTLRDSGAVKDMAMRLSPVAVHNGHADPVQEFDVAMTDGYYLTIVECKAGELRQEHVQKLENLARRFGGHFGRGVALCADPAKTDPATAQRIRSSSAISAVSAQEFLKDPGLILRVKPGQILADSVGKKRYGYKE